MIVGPDEPARRVAGRIALAVPAVAVVLLTLARLGAPVAPLDEGIVVTYGDLATRGAVPHRDFQSLYGPGMPWLIGATFDLFGATIGAERGVTLALRIAMVAGATAFARRWGMLPAIASGLVSAAMLSAMSPFAYPALAAAAACLCSAVLLSRDGGRARNVFAGLLGGAALAFRPDYVAAALVPALIVLGRRRWAPWRAYLAGLAPGVAALALHVVVATPSAVFANLVTDASRAVPSRRLPLPPGDADLALLLLATVVVCAWAIAAGLRSRATADDGAGRLLLAGGTLVALLLPQVVLRADRMHVSLLAATGAPLLVLGPWSWVREWTWTGPRRLVALAAASIVWASIALPTALIPPPAVPVTRGLRSYPDVPPYAGDVQTIVAAADRYVRPGMRLFIGPAALARANFNDTILYFLFPELVPASYYLEMEPGTANREGSRLAGDIATADMLILTTRWDDLDEPNDSGRGGSLEPDRVVAAEFRLVERDGAYALYVRGP